MTETIEVNTENMYEFCRVLSDFEQSLEGFENSLGGLTSELGRAMKCSRYNDVKDEVNKSVRKIEGRLKQVHTAASDLHARADFIEDFECGRYIPTGRRRIDGI